MKRNILFFALFLAAALIFLSPAGAALAQTSGQPPGQDTLNLLGQTGLGGSTGAADAGNRLPIIIGNIIRAVLGLLGIIFVVLLVYAGFLWMTARGEADKVDTAKDTIRNSIIGIIIIFLAYAITGFVVNAVINASRG